MAAFVFGLKQFRCYLLGRHFKARVDNRALTFYKQMKDPTGQAARYLDFMSNFSFDIQHRDGSKHTNADSLSRLRPCEVSDGEPCAQCNRRVTGRHSVKAVHTRSQAAETAEAGSSPSMAGAPPSGGELSGGKNRQRKRKRKSRFTAALGNTAPTAWQSVAGWTAAELREKQMNDSDIGPALTWARQLSALPGLWYRVSRLCCGRYGNSLIHWLCVRVCCIGHFTTPLA